MLSYTLVFQNHKFSVMGKKKLQLAQIKVNSFITPMNEDQQRTAKGGYVYHENLVAVSNDVSYSEDFSWTELKTRAVSSDTDLTLNNLKTFY